MYFLIHFFGPSYQHVRTVRHLTNGSYSAMMKSPLILVFLTCYLQYMRFDIQ